MGVCVSASHRTFRVLLPAPLVPVRMAGRSRAQAQAFSMKRWVLLRRMDVISPTHTANRVEIVGTAADSLLLACCAAAHEGHEVAT